MNGADHYTKAEELLKMLADAPAPLPVARANYLIERAKIHAELAKVAVLVEMQNGGASVRARNPEWSRIL